MPRKASTTTTKSATVASVTPITQAKGSAVTFTAVPISREAMPKPAKRGGRASNVPAIETFLGSITEPNVTYEMGSADEDGGHPVNRVAQVRKLAGEKFKVETSPIESGKRYRIFITLAS